MYIYMIAETTVCHAVKFVELLFLCSFQTDIH